MDALINYLFPKSQPASVAPAPVPPKPEDVSVYVTLGDVINVFRLSAVKDLNLKELREWQDILLCHVGSSFDTEEVRNGNIVLDAVNVRIRDLTT